MGHSVTLGGERVGSGNKSKVYMRNYERSTHNLSYDWLSTMGCGMLIPFMCELVTRDDKYEINLEAGLRTIPTKGPLFGSFKLQLDVYQCPLRLYQALLHNNPLAIGLKANQVKFPKIRLYDYVDAQTTKESKTANNSLLKYLGISGIGTIENASNTYKIVDRDLFGAHILAYYDIFKNYYANKQEESAYTLTTEKVKDKEFKLLSRTAPVRIQDGDNYYTRIFYSTEIADERFYTFLDNTETLVYNAGSQLAISFQYENIYDLSNEDLYNNIIQLHYNNEEDVKELTFQGTIKKAIENGYIIDVIKNEQNHDILSFVINAVTYKDQIAVSIDQITVLKSLSSWNEEVILKAFDLKNIDDMRYDILSFHQLGESYILEGDTVSSPYFDAIGDASEFNWQNPLSGICVKTYQSDIFNNWLNTEIIDGENGIAEITAISTSSGSITIDQLQFSEKLYNLLNRIAVSGGTYQDYLDAAYTASAKRFEESPIWIGGMSDEVIFEEIVQTAPAGDGILGTLGGRGNLLGNKKGGRITVKIDEPSLLIGIVSLTPRIVYTQGNKWFNTEIDSLQDIHVPALDAIGFQNLMAETMHFGSTIIDAEDNTITERPIIGKIPSWLHYMTNYDQAYGDFAATDGDGFMVLNRNYECKEGILQDATTYIDPAKFNYAFGYTKREAQNFWVKIKCSIKARRLMSAKQIPTA